MVNLEKLGLIIKENDALRRENAELKRKNWQREHAEAVSAAEGRGKLLVREIKELALSAGFEVVVFDGELCVSHLELNVRVFE